MSLAFAGSMVVLGTSCESEYTRFERSLTPIGLEDSTLFCDPTGRVFIRLPYREVHEDISQDLPYNYEQTVYFDWLSPVSLKKGLDIATFRRVPGTSNYWQDRHFIYTDPYVSYPGQRYFFSLGRRREVRLLPNPEFAYSAGSLYYRGVHVPGDTVPKSGHYP
ncbi:hypothetical protein [Hymenobacter metallilatus]|uniref:Uncharacterized protein n=1 Tax=Hymenobacter metallilatus TaxID=2493666 RepID=A0A428IY21_9BACT|nr:hypothetical protein [Hymenobacter metallilatus]RSK23965.1 hypothetical protein EI290_21495 [Hymenobacter metallilatus]